MNSLQARTEALTIAKAALDAAGITNVHWPDVAATIPTDPETTWARVAMRHLTGRQASLSDTIGQRRWTAQGLITVQVFAPMGAGAVRAHQIAGNILRAYQKAHGGSVWYRNPRMRDGQPGGAFTEMQVLVDFSYDDFQ